jgi:hypothetical protein
MDEDGGDVAEDATSRRIQSRVGLHLRGHRLQPRTHAESAVVDSSIRIGRGEKCVRSHQNRALEHFLPTRALGNGRKRTQKVTMKGAEFR